MNCAKCQTIISVHQCARCFTPVCAKHAGFAYRDEYQYDKESWVCHRSCRGLALVKFDPQFQVFDWTTVANAGAQACVNELAKLNQRLNETVQEIRIVNRVLAA